METAVLIILLVAVGLLMASGVWVGLVLIGAISRIKRPVAAIPREGPGNMVVSRPGPGQS
jgi:hypothetical protein